MKGIWETKMKDRAIFVRAKIAGYYKHNHVEHGVKECTRHYVTECPYCGYFCAVPVKHPSARVDVCIHFDDIHTDGMPYAVYVKRRQKLGASLDNQTRRRAK